MSRISQLDRPDLDEKQAKIYDAIVASRGNVAGPFRTWLHSPEFADRAQKLGEFVRYSTSLAPRLSELAILVTARFWDCQVEWTLHEGFAIESGLNQTIIDAIRQSQYPEFDHKAERAVYDYSSELLYNRFSQDRTFGAAADELGKKGVIELTGLIGYYSMVALTLNACQVPVPEDYEPTLIDCPTFRR